MKIAKVTGSVTATVKDAQLVGLKLLVCDIVDGAGKILEPAVVAVDTVGAGSGDRVLLSAGSAARLPAAVSGKPVDLAVTAIIDSVDIK